MQRVSIPASVCLMLLAGFAGPAVSDETMLEAFHAKSAEDQAEVIRLWLKGMFDHYVAEGSHDQALCMGELFEPGSSADPGALGYDLLGHALDRESRLEPAAQRSVERIIFDIVEGECREAD